MQRIAVFFLAPIVSAALATSAGSGPVVGFYEPFADGTIRGFSSGNALVNPGTGGADGAADGFLVMSNVVPFNLGTYNSGPDYAGDYEAAGVDRVRFKLNDVGTDDPIEMHLLVGNPLNLWESVAGFPGGGGSWQTCEVSLADSTQWIQVRGSGSFRAARQTADRLHWRHDLPPLVSNPDPVEGDIGLDDILFLSNTLDAGAEAPRVTDVDVSPNPASDRVDLAFTLSVGLPVRIDVFDLSGRLIRQLFSESRTAGRRTVRWNLETQEGRSVPPGLYVYRLRAAGGGATGKILVLR